VGALGGLEGDLIRVYREVRPSLVQVRLGGSEGDSVTEDGAMPHMILSGVVLAESATGCQVIVPGVWPAEQAERLAIYDLEGLRYSAQSIQVDAQLGLSLLEVPGLLAEPPVFGFAETLPVGSVVLVLGNAFGLEGSYSVGILSGRGRRVGSNSELMQVSNPINPGDGGGLVLDRGGRLIGIAMTSLAEAGQAWANERSLADDRFRRAQGVSFVIPLNQVLRTFASPLAGAVADRPVRPTLGLQVREAGLPRTERRRLALQQRIALRVAYVEPGFPADQAGLRVGDFILGMAGQQVQGFGCLFSLLSLPQKHMQVQILREGQILSLKLDFSKGQQLRGPNAAPRALQNASPAVTDKQKGKKPSDG